MATKKKLALAVFLIVIIVVTWWAVLQTPRHQLEKLGYSKAEASEIVDKLDNPNVELVIAHGYEAKLLELIRHAEFKSENLAKYLSAKVDEDTSVNELVLLANHADYDPSLEYDREMLAIMLDEYYLSANRERYFAMWQKMQLDEARNIEVPFGGDEDIENNTDCTTVADETDCVTIGAPVTAINAKTRKIVALVNAGQDRPAYENANKTDIDMGELMLVNKHSYLDEDYAPEVVELSAEFGQPGVLYAKSIESQLLEMLNAARNDGFKLYVTSGYRSYVEQQEVLNDYLAKMSEVEALNYAAKPGFSEHQTGLALDIFTVGGTIDNFATMPEAQWLADNAYKYGFILRYPEGKEDVTGYDYETWHYRYVGKETAEYLQNHDVTFDEWVGWKKK